MAIRGVWIGLVFISLISCNEVIPVQATFDGGQAVITPLSPNSVAETSSDGGANSDTYVNIKTRQGISIWIALLSSADTEVSVGADRTVGVIMLKKGLTASLSFEANGDYSVFISGALVDDQTEYNLEGKFLGRFGRSDSLVTNS